VTWWPVVVFGVALTAVLAWTFLWARGYRQTARARRAPGRPYVQHAARNNRTKAIEVYYPSEAAKDNDTRWVRDGDGTHSVAAWFVELPDGAVQQTHPWQRTYAKSFAALQRKD
jgi:hypothetical protein